MKQPKFEIGDLVTYASPELPYQKKRGVGTVVKVTREKYFITWDDSPKMECPHLRTFTIMPSDLLTKISDSLEAKETPQSSKIATLPEIAKPKKAKKPKPKPSLPEGIKLGDRVRNLDTNFEGTITHLCDRCINISTPKNIQSCNLEAYTPRLEILESAKIADFPETTAPDLHGYFEHYQPVIKGAKSYWYRRYVYVDISGKLRHHHVPNKMIESIETLWRSGATAKEICLALGKPYSGKNSA